MDCNPAGQRKKPARISDGAELVVDTAADFPRDLCLGQSANLGA